MPRGISPDGADRDQREERDRQQDHGNGGGARDVVALDLPEDVDGRDLGLPRDVAGDEDDRSELADGARERQRDAGEIAGNRFGKTIRRNVWSFEAPSD